MVREFGVPPQYIRELCGIYRETQARARRQQRPSGPGVFTAACTAF